MGNQRMHSNSTTIVQNKEDLATFSVIKNNEKTTKSRFYLVKNDCYKVTDLYRQCVSSGDLDSALCNSVVKKYMNCATSDK